MDLSKYRIYRTDPNNIAIQRRMATKSGKEKWLTISYHGHSLNSLISGLSDLIMREYTPEQEKLSVALSDVKLELVSGLEKIEKMIKEYCNDKT
jgi:hypothetical protein